MHVSAGRSFTPAPEGTHLAICVGIIDMGTQKGEWKGKPKNTRKVQVRWALVNCLREDGDDAGKPFVVTKSYTAMLGDNATLRKHLEAWRGKKFTKQELDDFDLSKLIGVPCQLQIVHEEREGKTYANIASIMGVIAGTPIPACDVDRILFTLDNFSQAAFDKLSPKMQELIAETPEFKKLDSVSREPGQDDDIPF